MANVEFPLELESRMNLFFGESVNSHDEVLILGLTLDERGNYKKIVVQSLRKNIGRCDEFEYSSGGYSLRGWHLLHRDPLTNKLVYNRREAHRFEPVS